MWVVTAIVLIILFAVDMVIPDFIPFADEILLALGSALSLYKAARPNKNKSSKKSSGSKKSVDVDFNEVDHN